MQLLSGAQKQKDTSLDHCSILHSSLPFPVKCFPAMPSSGCWACIPIALCKTRHSPKSHGKPPTGPELCLSLLRPMGAVGAPPLVSAKSPIPPMDSTVSNTAHLILARDCKGTHLSTNLGPNSQNGGVQDCKPKNEVC